MPSPIAVRKLTREQLGSFLHGNHLLIKAFENLIQAVGETIPDDLIVIEQLIEQAAIDAGNAWANSNSNAALIQALSNLTAGLALYPASNVEGLIQVLQSEVQGLKLTPAPIQFIQRPDYATTFMLMGS